MFEKPKFVQNSFSVAFLRQPQIRRRVNDFEDALAGRYGQPQQFPVPDELDPNVPRIVFGSLGGHSQVAISQIAVSLNVVYSDDWQTDISKGKEYLLERLPQIFSALKALEIPVSFSGIVTMVRIPARATDRQILSELVKRLKMPQAGALRELSVRTSKAEKRLYFNNLTLQNYRIWRPQEPSPLGPVPLPDKDAVERGVEILSDYNDRLAFNESTGYSSSEKIAAQIVDAGISSVLAVLNKFPAGE